MKFGLEISNIGKNKFQFQFHHWRDKRRVLEGQPWHFDHYALLLGELNELEKPSEAELCMLPVWARFYDVSFKERQNEGNVIILGNKVGEFLMHDKRETSGMEKSMRIRVLLDVTKPLKKHINLKMRGGFSNKVTVKYEKLPLFCFYCGRFGYGTKDCDEFHGDGSPIKNFNGGLKASPWRPIRDNDDDIEGSDKTCRARKLFIIQSDDRVSVSPLKGKVEAVVELLDHVDLNPKDTKVSSNRSKNRVSNVLGEPLSPGAGCRLHAEGDSSSSVNSEGDVRPSGTVPQTRKWRRKQRRGVDNDHNLACIPGFTGSIKRTNDSELSLYLSDFNNDAQRKRVTPMEVENSAASNVAGPTNRTLGES